ncbi:hypothetical protein CFIMG_006709RA [Ceratocystis fimbriata CBS 114723]|uniref:Uncharacterized protein n=1 Tax=Ceratocystis fimbriata CBS 114723 TaxID=1035309 RepID=A0A2C5WU18_9PEZI|nr:hypothetical protein CFIMG_006709RA [Ceratocystis fimbriata CBS 114723]
MYHILEYLIVLESTYTAAFLWVWDGWKSLIKSGSCPPGSHPRVAAYRHNGMEWNGAHEQRCFCDVRLYSAY